MPENPAIHLSSELLITETLKIEVELALAPAPNPKHFYWPAHPFPKDSQPLVGHAAPHLQRIDPQLRHVRLGLRGLESLGHFREPAAKMRPQYRVQKGPLRTDANCRCAIAELARGILFEKMMAFDPSFSASRLAAPFAKMTRCTAWLL